MKRSLNIAHRGFSGKYPENTMIAFEEAVRAGCDGIETDLHMTKDGIIVICHDEKLDRTTDGKGFIVDYNYRELKQFNAGARFSEGIFNEKIPTLDEFLDFVKEKGLVINMELKNNIINYAGLEESVIKKVHEYRLEENVILSSFNHYSMLKVKKLEQGIKTGLLYAATLYNVHEYAKGLNADAVHPFFPAVQDKNIVKEIKESGLMINTYTVNEKVYMKQLMELGIDGIITNFPDRMKELLG
jgi:Glycerophosphoryl diester phosphodiesterase